EMVDAGRGHFRLLGYRHGRPVCFAALAPSLVSLDEDWLVQQLRTPAQVDALQLMAGQPGGARDTSPVVCSCHQVREAALEIAIRQGCHDVAALGQCTRAGTGCGSCLPEIKSLLARLRADVSEENADVESVRALGPGH